VGVVYEMKKGQKITYECWGCRNTEMIVYRVSRGLVWCECEKCGAVDDFMESDYGSHERAMKNLLEKLGISS
jgi:ribosomal protein S27E